MARLPGTRSAARRAMIEEIASSRLFDARYYASIAGRPDDNVQELAAHYLGSGERRGLAPSALFLPAWYRSGNSDLRSYPNLLLHFLRHGDAERRSPHPLFLPAYYLCQLEAPPPRPFDHYLATHGRAGADPHPFFTTDIFVASLDSPLLDDESPLERYLASPEREEFLAPYFLGSHYALERGEAHDPRVHNAVAYLSRSFEENLSPHPSFDVEYYLTVNPDVRETGQHAYLHFLLTGSSEGRHPHPFDTALVGPGGVGGAGYGPARPEVLSTSFTGSYDVTPLGPAPGALPYPLVTLGPVLAAERIEARDRILRQDLLERLRLDWPVPAPVDAAPLVSFLMPVFQPPIVFLDRVIRSVRQQSCPRWELCICDDASEDDVLSQRLADYAAADPRIRVVAAARNGGISRATNAALDLATAPYVSLLDQDDLITVDAVERIQEAVERDPGLDWLYSDECIMDENDVPLRLFVKPDWSPLLLLATMYTGHLSVYRRSLVEAMGAFRPAYDFSQDYDLALRIAESEPRVHHLAAFLYGWRSIAGSAAQDGKPYARNTNLAALQDAVQRRGMDAGVLGLPASNAVVRSPEGRHETVSVIIPSDDAHNIATAVASVRSGSSFPRVEVVVVTRSATAERLSSHPDCADVVWVPYDLPFNFSDKCNQGAKAATGTHLVFFNDDVVVVSKNWLEVLLDAASLPGVGMVAPKLLYEDGTIQHAGMVTGVRRLVGTAFHTFPGDTDADFGLAQYAREVSLLCGACILMPADAFWQVDGFDAVNTPINHSDVDLCFRVRARGMSCLYTPFASLRHTGHVSIGKVEAARSDEPVGREKIDVFLLRRWPREIARDPYFPPTVRDLHYVDAQEHYQWYPASHPLDPPGPDVLLVTHDLTRSGAPRVLFDLAVSLAEAGCFVCVASPTDGPLRHDLTAAGVHVLVDSLVLTAHPSVQDLAAAFDHVVVNTVLGWQVVSILGPRQPVHWFVHESELIDHFVGSYGEFLQTFEKAAQIWAVGPRTTEALDKHGIPSTLILPAALRSLRATEHAAGSRREELTVGVIGSFEPRKGQDLALEAARQLKAQHPGLRLVMHGRVLDEDFHRELQAAAKDLPYVLVGPELDAGEYADALRSFDVVLIPSRDEALSLVCLDALALGKPLVVCKEVGASQLLPTGLRRFIPSASTPVGIARALGELLDLDDWGWVAEAGRAQHDALFSWSSFVSRVRTALNIGVTGSHEGSGTSELLAGPLTSGSGHR